MTHERQSPTKPKFSAEIIKERFRTMKMWLKQAGDFLYALEWLEAAEKYPEGSEERQLAAVRDEVDLSLTQFFTEASAEHQIRAEKTYCPDLLCNAIVRSGYPMALIRRLNALLGDETEPDGGISPENFIGSRARETYERVLELAGLAEEFPNHLEHSARQMQGWPMIVSHHFDGREEFERVAERLHLGADYPLDAGPRKKRGTATPLLRYLEPVICDLHYLRDRLTETEDVRKIEEFSMWIAGYWGGMPDAKTKPEILAFLEVVRFIPPLTRKSARVWSRKLIVPLVMLKDAGTAETCRIPALRNIWQHRSVKSRATFRSRLHSAVTDTLQRFSRAG